MLVTIFVGVSLTVIYVAWLNFPEKIKFILVSRKSSVPTRGTRRSAGYDLTASEECVVPAGNRKMVKTGVKCVLPANTYGRIASRSGLSLKHGIEVGAGVVDEDYTNELMVILYNHGEDDFEVKVGHRIAQLVIEKIVYPTTLVEIDGLVTPSVSYVRSTRGTGGFGSTGL
jgi:dUTP pyrophosphatase